MKFLKYDADKPIRSCCVPSVASASLGLLAVLIVSSAIFIADAHSAGRAGGGGGDALIAAFLFGPILFVLSLPWSYMFIHQRGPFALIVVILGAGVLLNALLMGFASGVLRRRENTLKEGGS
jgi:apolipoprotein N-acyltransferase